MNLRFALQVSRPGLWLTSVWFYCLPVAGTDVLGSARFWCGLFFVTFPMGFMIYGWNDAVDYESDRHNPRKGSVLFGAQGTREQLRRLPWQMVAVGLPFLLLFAGLIGPKALWLAVAGISVCGLYNSALKSLPPFEILIQFGYVLVLVFGSWLNDAPMLPWQTFVFGGMFAIHAHIFGEILDIDADRAAGRRTTATVLGAVPSKLLVAALLASEAVFCHLVFADLVFDVFLGCSSCWFVLDAALFWRNRPYTLLEMTVFMRLWNLVAAALLVYTWQVSALMHVAQ